MPQLLDLPEELLFRIAVLLPAQDLISFASTSSQLRASLRANRELWLTKCTEEWFTTENAYESCIYDLIKPKDESKITDYMSYFTKRKQIERRASQDIAYMAEIGFSRHYWELFFEHSMEYEIVPYLAAIDSKFPITRLDAKDKICGSLLTTMRHNLVFKAMEKYSESYNHMESFETKLLLPLSAMDTSFFNAISYRTSFYNKCHATMKKRIKNLEKVKSVSPTIIIKHSISVLESVLRQNFRAKGSHHHGIEEFLLPRVYCGEANPNELLFICILQEFSRQLGIKVKVANGALVISDSLSPQGVIYLILQKKSNFQYEYQFLTQTTFKQLLNNMNAVQGAAMAIDFETATKEMTGRDVYTEFFIGISQFEEASIIKNNELCQDLKLLEKAYPVTKCGIEVDEISYFGTFRKLLQFHGTRNFQPHNFEVIQLKFKRSILRWYPMDLSIKFKIIETETAKSTFLSTQLREYLTEPHAIPLIYSDIIGRFIDRNEEGYPGLILNYDRRNDRDAFEVLGKNGKKYTLFANVSTLTFIEYSVDDPLYHEFLTLNKRQRLDYLFTQKVSPENKVILIPSRNAYL